MRLETMKEFVLHYYDNYGWVNDQFFFWPW